MSVHKPKMKNIEKEVIDSIVQHHIPYELWMMKSALAAAIKGSWSQFEHNKNVEVFHLHARILVEFLKNGDACAFDPAYFTTEKFSVNRSFIRPKLADMMNEQISHLTDGRTRRRDEKLDVPH